MKDDLGGQIIKKFVEFRAKTYSYLRGNNDGDKTQNRQETLFVRKSIICKQCLKASQIENKIIYLEKKKKMMYIVLKKMKN